MSKAIQLFKKVYRLSRAHFCTCLFYLFRAIPLQNKIVATTFRGKKYGDNAQYVLEALHRLNPSIKIIWQKDPKFSYAIPNFIQTIPFYSCVKKAYHMATAKVWLDTHRLEAHIRKRKGQLFIETWHGGLGIKKIQQDVKTVVQSDWQTKELKNTCKLADLFITNSDHLTKIYRNAFHYTGKVWCSGYPKNDIFFKDTHVIYTKIRKHYCISESTRIFLYAPTFRDKLQKEIFNIDWTLVKEALENAWGGFWKILIRWHPSMAKEMGTLNKAFSEFTIDATNYPDMQELILGTDAFLSDYSSGIFDAALKKIPCFTYAPDYEEYKNNHGIYYELSDLPFPFAKTISELISNLNANANHFNKQKWKAFTQQMGLQESGIASEKIAAVINEFMQGNLTAIESIQSM